MMRPSTHIHHGVPGKLRRGDSMDGQGAVMMIDGAEVKVTDHDGALEAMASKFSNLVSARPPPGQLKRQDSFEIRYVLSCLRILVLKYNFISVYTAHKHAQA